MAPMPANSMSFCVSQGVALSPEKGVGGRARRRGGAPLDELVNRADRKADGSDQKEQPAAASKRRFPQENLAGDEGGHESLREVPEPVVVIAREMKDVPDPVAQRDLGVRVPSTDHEDRRVDGNQTVDERRQREATSRCEQEGDRNDDGEDLENPRQAVFRGPPRPDEHDDHARQQRHQRSVAFHIGFLRVRARRHARTMLACGGRFSAAGQGEPS